jgi:phosphatidylserine/phosphatidylglycerophosphate/cardiolipin synthase-like enzyme
MGVGRQQFMAAFAEEPLAGRIHFVSPVATGPAVRTKGGEPYSIHVHAKVLIVDDRFLRVGSSNLNNRSMGFDTECDLAIEASTAAQRRSIAAVRARLVAEHWGSDAESTALNGAMFGRRSRRCLVYPCIARLRARATGASRRGGAPSAHRLSAAWCRCR